ncbi:MAG TPA: tetratricopeptide repeat protein [Tepidisphaeraceae bacterium]|jgi:tetratricopeptide (TPR) repeat protein|nr:tetratricopeptide repeat protein [Tepidisphaeraceae bacterium]
MIRETAKPGKTDLLIVAGLLLGTLLLYGRTARFDFINLDDADYVYDNPHVLGGLTSENISWAFTTGFASNWHPLVWLSLMADVQLFGPKPGAIHLVNAVFHAANSALLFVLLLKLTNARWPAAWVGAMFAWHPLHVESVAWITERKDVLSAFFLMLCLLSYVRYVRGPSAKTYSLMLAMLVLGLMSKAMLVTAPGILLLLDIWPLRRLIDPATAPPALGQKHKLWSLVIEKVPLFVIVAASSIVTYLIQSGGRSVLRIPLAARLPNVVLSYARYLWMTIYPRGLAIFYPIAGDLPAGRIPVGQIIGSIVALLAISFIAIIARKRLPAILIGWLWYIGTLIPVIGLIQVGSQSHADRYTYVPLIGIFIAVAWVGLALWRTKSSLRPVIVILAVGSVVAVSTLTWRQIGFWRNAFTVMQHDIDVVPDGYFGYRTLGLAYDYADKPDQAMAEYQRARELKPNDAVTLQQLAEHAVKANDIDNALLLYKEALFANPYDGILYNDYGNMLVKKGKIDDAILVYRAGVQRDPNTAATYHNLALALAGQGKIEEAILFWRQAIQLAPNYAAAHTGLGNALLMDGQTQEGIVELRASLHINRDQADALNGLAWVLATHPSKFYQDGPEAEKWARRAVEISHGAQPIPFDTLAAAQAREGKFDEAIETARHAATLAEQQKSGELLKQIQARIDLYRSKHAFSSGQSD